MKLQGVGQGTKNVDTYWCFISVPMIELIAEAAPGYTHISTKRKERMKIHMMEFVDDKRHYVNSPRLKLKNTIIKAMEKYVVS